MYTIKQAAARCGVGISLLRAWERRYGIVTPSRTASGYRLYDDAAISRLRAMRRLVDAGWSASQAADTVLASPDSALEPAAPGASAGHADGPPDPEALVAAAAAYDTVAIEATLDDLLSRGSYEAVIDDLLLPAVAALGTAWEDGRIDVAAEHLASAAVQRRLAALFDLAGAPSTGRLVAVGLPPGCRHEIGTIAFAVALRRRGINVLYLGPDVPLASWVHVVAEPTVDAAMAGIARPADEGPGREVVAAMATARPDLLLAVGGPSSGALADTSAHVLATRVAEAATELAGLMAAR
ncbi:MAG: MerR family transcriptional regulator [Chloroflexi bacterium]|nr:MerR family transcriptional regulator [Chloroflexota bacterium]